MARLWNKVIANWSWFTVFEYDGKFQKLYKSLAWCLSLISTIYLHLISSNLLSYFNVPIFTVILTKYIYEPSNQICNVKTSKQRALYIFMNRIIYINICQISLGFTQNIVVNTFTLGKSDLGSNVKVCGNTTRSPSWMILGVEGCHIHCLDIGWMYGERAPNKWWVIRSTS